MISKELFEEITGYLDMAENIDIIGDSIGYTQHNIDIYKFIEKIIKWANMKGYTVIYFIDNDCDDMWTCRAYPNGLNDGYDYEEIYQFYSYDAVINACEWILKEINK